MKFKATFLKIALLFVGVLMSSQIFAQADDNVCAGEQDAVYAVQNPTGGSTYAWTLSGGGAFDGGQTGTSVTIDWGTTAGTYTLSVYETNSSGCAGDTTDYEIEIHALPVLASVAAADICAGEEAEVVFTFTSPQPNPINIRIEFNDGNNNTFVDTATASPFTYTTTGVTYNADPTFTVTSIQDLDANSCSPSAALPSTVMTVNSRPAAVTIVRQ